MLAEPIAIPSKGTAQQEAHAMPVIKAMRLVIEIPDVSSFNTLKSFLSGKAGTVKPGVRSMVKPQAETPTPSIERTCPGKPGHASHLKR
jgi:hypothetical protein